MARLEETTRHPLEVRVTPSPQPRRGPNTSTLSYEEIVNSVQNTPKHWYGGRQVLYPFNENGRIYGREVRRDNHRHDERLIVELLNDPLSVPIPRVDMVILYHKKLKAVELSRIKSFHGGLICNGNLKINLFRDHEGGFFFAKLYIPYESLHEQSDFKFASEAQYTTVQRVYAIQKIINKTVVLTKFITDEHYERYDYRRLYNDGIIAGSYVPHEPQAQQELLHSWAMIKNLLCAQPIEKIKEYVGAQVAIHFAWSGYFNVSLLLGALFGLASYACSLVVTHWQYDYAIEEVCAGVYDYYPRCPLCANCEYTKLSSSCFARRRLRRSSNITFCVLTSFLVSGLLTSFKNYLRNLTASWEEPNTRQDLAVHHLSMTSQNRAPLKDSVDIEPIRIEYLRKFPQLMDVYDLAVKPSLDFEEMTNVCLQHIEPFELQHIELNNTVSSGGGEGVQNQGAPRNATAGSNPEDEIISIHDETPQGTGDGFALRSSISLTPEQFQEVSQRVTADDEFGFVMTPTRGNNSFSPPNITTGGGGSNGSIPGQQSPAVNNANVDFNEALSQQVAKEQDEEVYQIHGLQALIHCLVAWAMTFLFAAYFVFIVIVYIFFLSTFKPNNWLIQPFVNFLLNIFFRVANGKVVYYLTFYQVPKYESQFNKWLTQKLMALFYTEYALFFYTAIFAQFYFTNPNKLKDPPYNLQPCNEDDCHYTLANTVGKILTVDQVSFIFYCHFWPMMANKMWGCSFCETTLFRMWVSFTYYINSLRSRLIYNLSRLIWSIIYRQSVEEEVLPPKEMFAVGSKHGNWYTDARLVAYSTQPYMYEQYLTILKMFGYVALFGANWFMAPFVLYLVSLIYIRIHATHLLTNHRRPIPERAKNLGVWNKYIDSMVLMSFVTTGFTFAFLSGVVPQTIHLLREGTLRYYVNTTLSFYGTKNSSSVFPKAHTDRDYCIYNGNMEPPWAEEPFTLSSVGCFRLFYKMVFFVLYGGVFYGICRWLRFDLVDLFDILYDMTVAVFSPLFKRLNRLVTPAPYTRKPSTDGSNPLIIKASKDTSAAETTSEQKSLPRKAFDEAKKILFKKKSPPEVIDLVDLTTLQRSAASRRQLAPSDSTSEASVTSAVPTREQENDDSA